MANDARWRLKGYYFEGEHKEGDYERRDRLL